MDITEEHIAAAQLRLVLDEKLGRATPERVRRVAAAEAGSPPVTPVPVALPESDFSVVGRYLQAIGELREKATHARLAERLGHSAPTTSEMIRRLLREGLISGSEKAPFILTQAGAQVRDAFVRLDRDLVLSWPVSSDVNGAIQEVIDALTGFLGNRSDWLMTRQGTDEVRIGNLTEPEVGVVLATVADWTSRHPGSDVDVRRGARVAEVRAEDAGNIAALIAALAV
ncbi:winged helix-turn-helix transcriptional regulator [Amycolatopsis sp. NPDC003861]